MQSTIKLSIRTLTGQAIPVEVPSVPTTTVLELKQAIEQARDIPVDHQRLIFAGRELQDQDTLTSYGISNECAVHLLLKKLDQPPRPSGGLQPIVPEYDPRVQAGYPVYQNPPPVAIPIGLQPPAEDPVLRSQRLMECFRLGRIVKLFAVIDGIFLLILALNTPIIALGVLLTIAGYYGAKNYKRFYIWLYLLYLLGFVALRVYLLIQHTDSVPWVMMFAISILIELYIMKIVFTFSQRIKDITDEDRQELSYFVNPNAVF